MGTEQLVHGCGLLDRSNRLVHLGRAVGECLDDVLCLRELFVDGACCRIDGCVGLLCRIDQRVFCVLDLVEEPPYLGLHLVECAFEVVEQPFDVADNLFVLLLCGCVRGIAVGDKHHHFAHGHNLLADVFHQPQCFGDAGLKMPRMDIVFGEDLPCLGRDDFKPALAHEGVVDVVELGPFADNDRVVELDLYAGAVAEPGDRADGTYAVAADNDFVFGLQGPEFLEIDNRRVRNILVRFVHAIGNACKNAD